MDINLIVGYDNKTKGIGKNGKIPWHNKTDIKWFKEITIGNGNNAVVMGRKTYESIGKPLPGRLNIIISTTLQQPKSNEYYVVDSLQKAVNVSKDFQKDSLFIIGGSSLYNQALSEPFINNIDTLFIDEIKTGLIEKDFDTFFEYDIHNDTRFKSLNYNIFNCNDESVNMKVYYNTYNKKASNDFKYFNLIVDILNNGRIKHTRAGETISVFNRQVEFDLREGLPVLTSKKMYMKGSIHELLWFLHGSNNIKYLVDNNTHIWDSDAYRYFLEICKDTDKLKNTTLDEFLEGVKEEKILLCADEKNDKIIKYTYGDVGPIYGSQWINWDNKINQLDNLIEKLKTNPDDRRLMVSAWNVADLPKMALPPCHYTYQLYVDEMTHEERVNEYKKSHITEHIDDISDKQMDKENIPHQYLSCMWQQRSVDVCLGLPFDILSFSILLSMVSQLCNMVPYKLIGTLGDTHIYKNQIDTISEQLIRNPFKYNPPQLELNRKGSIYDYKYDDIKINNYKSYPPVKYKLSVGL